MFKKIKYLFYNLLHPKLRHKFFEIIFRKLKIIFFKDYTKKINDNNHYKLSNKDEIYKILNISDIVNPQEMYQSIFEESKRIIKKNPVTLGGAGDLELLYNISKLNNINKILETGVANGWSSLSILLSIKDDLKKSLVSIDLPYPFKNSEEYIGRAVPFNLRKKWNLIIDNDKKILSDFLLKDIKFDLIHYDSDKSYDGRIKSYNIIWKILNTNGILISDDVSDNNAFAYFSKTKKMKPIIYEYKGKHIGFIKK